MPTVVRKTLREFRRAAVGWSAGLSAFLLSYISVYASIKEETPALREALRAYPEVLKNLLGGMADIVTGTGFLQASAYQLLGPLLFILCAVSLGNRAIAVPEESGTLELTVTLPIDRKRLLLERWAGLVLSVLAVALVTLAVVGVGTAMAEMGVPFGRILAAHTGLFLLVLFFGTLALCAGAATGRRQVAAAVTGVWAVAGYLVETYGKSIEAISWLRPLSPFHYYLDGRPLYEGWPIGDYLVLLGATAVLLATAVLAFDRRDLGV